MSSPIVVCFAVARTGCHQHRPPYATRSTNTTSISSASFLRFFQDVTCHSNIGQVAPRFMTLWASITALTPCLQLSDPASPCFQRLGAILAAIDCTHRRKATAVPIPHTFQSKISRSLSRNGRTRGKVTLALCRLRNASALPRSRRCFAPEGTPHHASPEFERPTHKRLPTKSSGEPSWPPPSGAVCTFHSPRRSLIPDRDQGGALARPQVPRTDCGCSSFKEHT